MRLLVPAILFIAFASAAQTAPTQPDSQGVPQAKNATANATIVVPAGTTVPLALTSPILAKNAKAGESVYAETAFPVAMNNQMAIPPGTYVQGQIDALTRPGWLSPHAQFEIHFTKIIFANGYTIELPGSQGVTTGQALAPAVDVIAAVATPYVQISSASDVLLDNGSQFEMVLQVPLQLNAAEVAAAARMANPAALLKFRSATLCRPIPGTPGTPDTVIPGTPGTPGTPDIVIPGTGTAATPPIVIPGTPATPGTPDTVIPGSSSTPGVVCPGPPLVTSNPKVPSYKESFQIGAAVQVSGKQLSAGSYEIIWEGSGPSPQVNILQSGNPVVSVRARFVLLSQKSSANTPGTRANSDGSLSLVSLRFAGQDFALYFD